MAYMRYKELTKYFNFSRGLSEDTLPKYVFDYIYEDEQILDSYKTSRDVGVFTDRKIILFDHPFSFMILDKKKEVTIIPYTSISTCSIIFRPGHAELFLMFHNAYPLRLKFKNMRSKEKECLRKLYYCISKVVTGDNFNEADVESLRKSINTIKTNGAEKQ